MIRKAEIGDAHELARRVRKADRKEIAAASGASALKALLTGTRRSTEAKAFDFSGVQALFGVVETAPGEGIPWLVGSDAIFGKAKWPFARVSRAEVERMQARWPKLFGWAHADNAAHLRWLEWCGFRLSAPEPWGVSGEPFRYFERTTNV